MEFLTKEPKQIDYLMKVIISGKDKTGKSIFDQRLGYNNIDKQFFKSNYLQYKETMGFEFISIYIKFNNKNFKLQIWDTQGNELYIDIIKCFFHASSIVLLFYDAFDKQSFEYVKKIYSEQKNLVKCLFYLIRIKYDLNIKPENKDFVSDEEALEYADKNNILFLHLSSFEKYDNGINSLLNYVLKQYLLNNNN